VTVYANTWSESVTYNITTGQVLSDVRFHTYSPSEPNIEVKFEPEQIPKIPAGGSALFNVSIKPSLNMLPGNYTVQFYISSEEMPWYVTFHNPVGINVNVPAAKYTIELSQGWNLIGLPNEPQNPALETVFAENLTLAKWIYTYINGAYVWLHPHSIAPAEMHAGYAYWVYANQPFTITITGTPTEAPTLFSGWNLIAMTGLMSPKDVSVEEFVSMLNAMGYNVNKIWGYEAGVWYTWTPSIKTLKQIKLGHGYWVAIEPKA
jgi:hypothetical protein